MRYHNIGALTRKEKTKLEEEKDCQSAHDPKATQSHQRSEQKPKPARLI